MSTDLADDALDADRASRSSTTHTGLRGLPWRARLLLGLLSTIDEGRIDVTLPDGRHVACGRGEPAASVRVAEWGVFRDILSSGDVGFAEGYMRGAWTTDDVARLLFVLAANREPIERAVYGGPLGGLVHRIRHLMNANTRRGSRRNIAAHYDLGNDFYAAWLDPSMTYSSAIFTGEPGQSLEAAQTAKYRRILDRLGVGNGDRILEIGCGWGGFAELAIRERGCHVTGLSLSREQLAWAQARIDRAGLAEHAAFEYRDYRDVQGRFDHIVSIEMYEAVGEKYWPDYFAAIRRLLEPGGGAVVQAITIDDRLFERYRSGTDFIQQYIFPGGMLASPSRFEREARAQGLDVADAFAFGSDYAETLRRWRHAFHAALPAVRSRFDERFVRMWTFYLAYCEGAFDSGCTDVYQYELRHA
jgi:cyclopropane-fatty-acyl-phospholipid synthase